MKKKKRSEATASIPQIPLPVVLQGCELLTSYAPTQTLHELFISGAVGLQIHAPVSRKNSQAPLPTYKYFQGICLHPTSESDTFVLVQPPKLMPMTPIVTGTYRLISGSSTPVPVQLNALLYQSSVHFFRTQEHYDVNGRLEARVVWQQNPQSDLNDSVLSYYEVMREADGSFKKTLFHSSHHYSRADWIEATSTRSDQTLLQDFQEGVRAFRHIILRRGSCVYGDIRGDRSSLTAWHGSSTQLTVPRPAPEFIKILARSFVIAFVGTHLSIAVYVVVLCGVFLRSYAALTGEQFPPFQYGMNGVDAVVIHVFNKLRSWHKRVFMKSCDSADKTEMPVTYHGTFSNPFLPKFIGPGAIEEYVRDLGKDREEVIQLARSEGVFKEGELLGRITKTVGCKKLIHCYDEHGLRVLLDIGEIYFLDDPKQLWALEVYLAKNAHYYFNKQKEPRYAVNKRYTNSLTFFEKVLSHGSAARPFVIRVFQQLSMEQAKQLHQVIAHMLTKELSARLMPREEVALVESSNPVFEEKGSAQCVKNSEEVCIVEAPVSDDHDSESIEEKSVEQPSSVNGAGMSCPVYVVVESRIDDKDSQESAERARLQAIQRQAEEDGLRLAAEEDDRRLKEIERLRKGPEEERVRLQQEEREREQQAVAQRQREIDQRLVSEFRRAQEEGGVTAKSKHSDRRRVDWGYTLFFQRSLNKPRPVAPIGLAPVTAQIDGAVTSVPSGSARKTHDPYVPVIRPEDRMF